MKTLILTDETFERLMAALSKTAQGRDVLDAFAAKPPKLPSTPELVKLDRTKGPAPDVIRNAREVRDAGRQAAEDTRLALNDVIVKLWKKGVRPATLARWSELHVTRIHELVAEHRDTEAV